jgi:peptidoglycan lytic transglycosylase D
MTRGICAPMRHTHQTDQGAGASSRVHLSPPSAGPWAHRQPGGRLHVSGCCVLLVAALMWGALLPLVRPASAEAAGPHFPKPVALHANVQFWKQIYSEYGVADFVLHDRDNLAAVYAVVRVEGATSESRAAALAQPMIQQLRERYAAVLERLAQGTPPAGLGGDGVRLAQVWGCPCAPEVLRRAAASIRVQQGHRERFQEGLQRARTILAPMLSILKRHNVPEELAALPMVESSFHPDAQSKAGAVGIWQFIESTGRHYLTITRWHDDRSDPFLATEAAARLLKDNYDALGSWPLAITAYNHGKGGVLAARAAVGSDAIEDIIQRYTGPRFGFASRNFYAEFLAALELIQPTLVEHSPSSEIPLRPRPKRQG